jgi:hypothetical protein
VRSQSASRGVRAAFPEASLTKGTVKAESASCATRHRGCHERSRVVWSGKSVHQPF